jgi:hypothetical protein
VRKLLAGTVLAVTVFIVWRLVSGRPGTAADEVKRMPAGEAREAAAEVRTAEAEEARLSRLAAAYAPGVVVLTNAVLAFDPRKRVKVPSEEWSRYQAEKHGVSKLGGPKAKVTFHVVDEDGNSVTNATVSVNLAVNNVRPVTGRTDCDGLFTAEGRLSEELIYGVTKDGFYKTRSTFSFGGLGIVSMEEGRRIPWNPTFRVTLKQVRNPIPMYARQVRIELPKKSEKYGYDLVKGDLVEPYGKGRQADMVLSCFGDKPPPLSRNYKETLVIESNCTRGGFVRRRKDGWSTLFSVHEAPREGYLDKLTLHTDSEESRQPQKIEIGDDCYIIIRSRVTIDVKDGLESACFGKIYGPVTFGITTNDREGAGVAFKYYFNPAPNDRNIEYAPRNNLFKGLKSYEDVYEP